MAGFSLSAQPPGVIATIVGGLVGGAVVYLVGPPIANAVAAGDLGGLGTALVLLLLMWCVGTGLGVVIALALRRHERAGSTAVLAIPGMVIAVVATLVIGRQVVSNVVLWSLLLGACILVLWLARVLAMTSTPRPARVRE